MTRLIHGNFNVVLYFYVVIKQRLCYTMWGLQESNDETTKMQRKSSK